MEIHLPGAKTDQHRQGNTIFVARTNTPTCPVAITERYMRALGDSLTPDSYLLLLAHFLERQTELRHLARKVKVSLPVEKVHRDWSDQGNGM